jgi:hypothetical protein
MTPSLTYAIGQKGGTLARMTKEDDALQSAIIDQINAELGATSMTMKELAAAIGRPYDSTRNYLKKERSMPLGVFLECAAALGVDSGTIIARARERLN